MASSRIKGITVEIAGDTRKLSDELKAVEKDGERLGKELKEVDNLLKFDPGNVEALAEKQKILAEAIENSNEKLKRLRDSQEQVKAQFESGQIDRGQYLKFCEEIAATEKQTADYAKQLEEVKTAQEQAGNSADKAADDISDAAKSEKNAADNAEDMAAKTNKAADAVKGMAKAAAAAVGAVSAVATAASAMIAAVVKQSVESYAEYEQLVGGVETLFKDSSDTIQQYAADAYKTAGISANEYMETVTGFSAALISSVGNDTEKAAKLADMAITDMSDNANKMGSDMGSLQTAYNGFAKQNYTMLDNLKLGYGGTKEEMQRLLDNANRINEEQGIITDYQIENYADIVEAIHVVQTEMDITGTTAKEASTTIAGSLSSAKSAWSNLITGIADDNADFDTLINNFVDSIVTASQNILPRIQVALNGVSQLISEMVPVILNTIPPIITDFAPQLLTTATDLINALLDGIVGMMPVVSDIAIQFITTIVDNITGNLVQIIDVAAQMVLTLASGIAAALPELVPAAVGIVTDIVDILLDNVNLIIDGALQLITGLADGLLAALPVLIDKVPDIITGLVSALLEAQSQIVECGVTLLTSIVEDLPTIISSIVNAVPKIITGLIDTLVDGIPRFISTGVELFASLVEAIPQAVVSITAAVPQICTAIIDTIMNTDWLALGSDIIGAIAEGISEGAKSIENMTLIQTAADSIYGLFGIGGGMLGSGSSKQAADSGAEMARNISKGFADGMRDSQSEISASMPYNHAAKEAAAAAERIKTANESLARRTAEQQKQTEEAYSSTAKAAEGSAKKQTAASAKAAKDILSEGKKAYDEVLDLYKDGKISYEEYNRQYTGILGKYSTKQAEITEYAQKKMTEVAEKEAEERVKALKKSIEDEISEYQKEFDAVQKEMETFSGKLTKAYKDVYTFTTDEKTGKISAKTTDVMIKSKKELEEYLKDIEKLQKRGVSNVMLQQLTDMSKEEGAAVAEYWLSLSDNELKNLQNNWTAYNKVSAKISETIYADEAKSAAESMLNAIGDTLGNSGSDLEDSGIMILQGLKEGILNDKGIKEIKSLCDGIINTMTEYLSSSSAVIGFGTEILNGRITQTTAAGGNSKSGAGNTYYYTQNNYSPKALSRDEINRETKRQLQLAGMK